MSTTVVSLPAYRTTFEFNVHEVEDAMEYIDKCYLMGYRGTEILTMLMRGKWTAGESMALLVEWKKRNNQA